MLTHCLQIIRTASVWKYIMLQNQFTWKLGCIEMYNRNSNCAHQLFIQKWSGLNE